jgi:hypothetical protein
MKNIEKWEAAKAMVKKVKQKTLDHRGHRELARLFKKIDRLLANFGLTIDENFQRTHPVYKQLDKFETAWGGLQSKLDDHYHSVTSESQFKQAGHIYYGKQTSDQIIYEQIIDAELFFVRLWAEIHKQETGRTRKAKACNRAACAIVDLRDIFAEVLK